MDLQWIAVRSKPRAEKVAFDQLMKKGIEAYLPLIKKKRKWSDRKKWVDFPLFSSYLFAKIELKNSIYVLRTSGVSTIVKFNRTILTIPENVIKSIQLAIEGGYELQPVEFFTKGDDVEVIGGPLRGTKGIVIEKKNGHRLVIKIDALEQAVAVHIDSKFLQSVSIKRASIL